MRGRRITSAFPHRHPHQPVLAGDPPWARSIFAIVVGFVLTGALNVGAGALFAAAAPELAPRPGTPATSTGVLLVVSAYVAFFGILGCYLTARLAPTRPMLHALIMGGLALAMSIAACISAWSDAPVWFNLYNLLAVMPYAWVGGRIRETELTRAAYGEMAL